jgi:hypothetical protein
VAYRKGGGVQGLLDEGAEAEAPEENSIIEHNGQKFKRVQIEGENQEYFMDEEGNIFDLDQTLVSLCIVDGDELLLGLKLMRIQSLFL